MDKQLRVLLVEDSENDAVLITRELKKGGYDPVAKRVETAEEMRSSLTNEKWDAVISDYVMPRFDGLSAFKVMRETNQDLPFIVVSGSIGEDIAVDAMKAGVHDYIMKDNMSRLPSAIDREIREARVRWDRRIDAIIIDELASYPRMYPNPIVEVERDGNIHYMNPRAKKMFPDMGKLGFAHAFLSGLDAIWGDIKRSAEDSYDREISVGGVYYQQVMYYVRDRDNVRIYSVDITKRKNAEDELKNACDNIRDVQYQLIRTSKMAAAGMVTSSIAQEISSPLTGVLSSIQMLEMDMEQKKIADPEFKSLISAAEESANRCKKIVQSFLTYARASQGKFAELDLNELIENTVKLLEREFYHDNITIVRELAQDLPMITGDGQMIRQVIFDLLVNAKWAVRKNHTAGGGIVAVSSSTSSIDGRVIMKISDNGIGVSRENMDKIFSPYFTTKASEGETGLGLAIAADILRSHKAFLEAKSEGQGAVFTVSFPARSQAEGSC